MVFAQFMLLPVAQAYQCTEEPSEFKQCTKQILNESVNLGKDQSDLRAEIIVRCAVQFTNLWICSKESLSGMYKVVYTNINEAKRSHGQSEVSWKNDRIWKRIREANTKKSREKATNDAISKFDACFENLKLTDKDALKTHQELRSLIIGNCSVEFTDLANTNWTPKQGFTHVYEIINNFKKAYGQKVQNASSDPAWSRVTEISRRPAKTQKVTRPTGTDEVSFSK
jgi:hypothetical protein